MPKKEKTEGIETALDVKRWFEDELAEISRKSAKSRRRITSATAAKVAGIEKDHQAALKEIDATRLKERRDLGNEHSKRIQELRKEIDKEHSAYQSRLDRLDNHVNGLKAALRAEKKEKLDPIERQYEEHLKVNEELRGEALAKAEARKDAMLDALDKDHQDKSQGSDDQE